MIIPRKSQLENNIKFQNGHLKSTICLSYKLLKPGWFYINSTIKLNKLGCLLNLINLKLYHKRPIFYEPGSRTLRKTWPILFVATQLKRSNLCVRLTTNSRYNHFPVNNKLDLFLFSEKLEHFFQIYSTLDIYVTSFSNTSYCINCE